MSRNFNASFNKLNSTIFCPFSNFYAFWTQACHTYQSHTFYSKLVLNCFVGQALLESKTEQGGRWPWANFSPTTLAKDAFWTDESVLFSKRYCFLIETCDFSKFNFLPISSQKNCTINVVKIFFKKKNHLIHFWPRNCHPYLLFWKKNHFSQKVSTFFPKNPNSVSNWRLCHSSRIIRQILCTLALKIYPSWNRRLLRIQKILFRYSLLKTFALGG